MSELGKHPLDDSELFAVGERMIIYAAPFRQVKTLWEMIRRENYSLR